LREEAAVSRVLSVSVDSDMLCRSGSLRRSYPWSFSPAALASFACRSSKVQNRSAPSSRADATCRVSRVVGASRVPCCWASRTHVSKDISGMLVSAHTPRPRSAMNSEFNCRASESEIRRRNSARATACAHSARCSGVSHRRRCPEMRRRARPEFVSLRYRETRKLEST
jgi:hypothetical protein